jgi:hypothetical protein
MSNFQNMPLVQTFFIVSTTIILVQVIINILFSFTS